MHPLPLVNSVKTSTEFGYEMPMRCEKIIPGDILRCQHAHRLDFAPLSTKLLQEFRVKSESFFVPTRILWKDFEEFFVAEDNSIIHPYFSVKSVYSQFAEALSLFFDFTGVDADEIVKALQMPFSAKGLLRRLYGNLTPYVNGDVKADLHLDALKLYAYYRILAEYYFDENLQQDFIELLSVDAFKEQYQQNSGDMSAWVSRMLYLPVYMNLVGTASFPSSSFSWQTEYLYYLRGFCLRNYPKDYFTGALPWKQKGNTVMIPSSQEGEVRFYVQNDVSAPLDMSGKTHFLRFQANANDPVFSGYKGVNPIATEVDDVTKNGYIRTMTAKGAGVTSIEDFRTAYELQIWLEKNARGGTRYKEQILSHFGIHTKDSRLDRPEFIMGTTDVIQHGDVFTTFQDEAGNGVPAESVTRLSGYGRSSTGLYKATEHGYYIELFCLFPKASYAQGVFRQGLELDKFDYFWPEFEHLGEQEVFQCEIAPSDDPMAVFGYVPRYAQYKCRQNEVDGDFAESLTTFTNYRDFPNAALNGQFIQIDAVRNNLNRSFNVVNAKFDRIYIDYYVNLYTYRPMDYYGVPRLVL